MRSKSDKKKPLVPRLRFPEFREAGAWEVKRLGGIGSVSMCKRILKSQTSESGDIPFYKIGTFSKQADAFIENKIYEEFKEKYSFPNKGDILISASGTIGRTVVYDGKPAYFQDSNIVWIANNENILLNAFLYYCYKTIQWQTDDNTISRLYNDNLRKMKIVVPPIPEQQKIAHCLSSLDEVIGLQAKKVQALKQHKKGLMQQLFPAEGETTPRLRFPEFREAGAWEVKRLGEVADVVAAGDLNVDDYSTERTDKYIFPIYSNSVAKKGLYGFCATPKYKENSVTVTARGTLGVAFHRNCNFAAIGRLLVISNLNVVNPYFLQEIWNHSVQLPLEDGGIPQLTAVKAKPAKVAFPRNTHEQQKIAHCLSSLDEVIGLESHKLDTLKNLKKGLMQQLFP
ncbi:restriction endonuclease subunit S, partial [Thiolapillus sp.]|uniref:restriction endonuclease subunit S n=3 Tax=Thiolapillus sp. TaxID=2017437 RepID=UPI003AF7737C